MSVPGPAELGRSVIVAAGAPAPAAWAGAERIVVAGADLAEPDDVATRLHQAWRSRTPVVIDLHADPGAFRAPRSFAGPLWELGPGHEDGHERLHLLVWANAYDARGAGEPIWWWARKAARLGASEAGPADVVLPDGTPAWIDGGPRAPLPVPVHGAAVVHGESVELGSLRPQPVPVPPSAELAPDQLAAVAHGSGPARVIAPAGSGKTRVLTERYRHLLVDRGYEPGSVLALAYNKRAQQEMAARLHGLPARIQTINAWGYSLVARARGHRPEVLDERAQRSIVEALVPSRPRRVNTDPIGPYLAGLSLIRLGLRHPEEVEGALDDVAGLAGAYEPYRDELRRRGAVDFDEQVFGAAEALLRDGELRRSVQADHRHLLVDELQDLTPAHVLLVRLAAGPQADVFAVGDDDQVIYGHTGADPRFLVDFDRFFPGAHHHALEVGYRCPAPVTDAARRLLAYNRVRVPKQILAGPGVRTEPDTFEVRTHAGDTGARALLEAVEAWQAEGAAPSGLAVLTRVQSLLLAPHVALSEAGVPLDSILDEGVLSRLGVRAALAYLRIAVAPTALSGADLAEVHRRPSRGLPQWATRWLERCRSVADVRRAAARIDDPKVGAKLDDLAADLDRLARSARAGATTRDLLTAVRDDIGLGSAMTLLDSTGAAAGSHLDDLEALLQVADLHPEASSFEAWLRRAFHRERVEGGVTLATIHRVKGQEWDRVIVFGVTDGIVPHRLADDLEEERRVLHVGITRGRHRVLVLGDRSRRSPFLAELDGSAPRDHLIAPTGSPSAGAAPTRPSGPDRATLPAAAGQVLKVLGGYEGAVAEVGEEGVRLRLADGGSFFVRFGERVTFEDRPHTLGRPPSPQADAAAAALRAWRLARAKADRVPAYVVLADKHLEGIAERMPSTLEALRACPGIGPAKLESYGEEILDVLAGV